MTCPVCRDLGYVVASFDGSVCPCEMPSCVAVHQALAAVAMLGQESSPADLGEQTLRAMLDGNSEFRKLAAAVFTR